MFITFNTIKQAENFIKRQPAFFYMEGCGCCGHEQYYSIKGNKVIYFSLYRYAGHNTIDCKVVGKIKKKVGVAS